ncbi:MAG TPA: helicase-related protein [Vicinamibacterales bacterium]|nr:helicase-related protein [Vicinamibacterales bacterium]
MQNSQLPRPGDLVAVRRSRWHVVDVRPYDGCALVTLRGVRRPYDGTLRRVVSPFDVIEPVDRVRRARFVDARAWRCACRAAFAADGPAGGLLTAGAAAIDLLPYQLEPALAVVRGLGTRLLLADEVGLGKTIQAGLVAAELIARGSIDRVLILAPAGLRDQWMDELSHRFGITSTRVDARMLRRAAVALPIGVNPWSPIRVAVASIDYVKRPEVVPAVTSIGWDLVIVDEAHTVAADSDRRAAAHAAAARAPYVVLLTATPHSGDRDLFASLCEVGAVDASPVVVFRRTRSDVGIPARRRVHIVRVNASPAERRMHAQLMRYAIAIRAERGQPRAADALLALGILHKRMLSSAWSLAQSVERRLASIATSGGDGGEQLMLPLGDSAGELNDADQPPRWPSTLGLADCERERRLLTALLTAAREASGNETKLRRITTLLRRTREPVVIFTEYRDTLLHIQPRIARPTVVLHGGLRREERVHALQTFASTPESVLLATDAAAEGLNLHHHCRSVVNLELPWNPSRLEQRIGRVDRIGQPRTVHAFHLLAVTIGETAVLDRLRARIAAAESDVQATSPLSDRVHERAISRRLFSGDSDDEHDDGEPAGGRGR